MPNYNPDMPKKPEAFNYVPPCIPVDITDEQRKQAQERAAKVLSDGRKKVANVLDEL
jgi:hypothetical protein